VAGPISYDLMASDTAAFLDTLGIGRAHLVGHSDGANVALLVALARPDLVDRLVLISGNFRYDGLLAGLDLGDLAANTYLADAYAQVSPDGRDHFPVVAAKIVHMAATEPALTAADLARVGARTLVMAGDDDAIAPAHTEALYRGIPDSELAVIPGTSHALIIEKPGLCNQIILDFLTTDPVPTYMPIRRARPEPDPPSPAAPGPA
jgi:pimeloyl-ACP methyl ester carboxylesterase